ncbi:hypothetical protein F0L68_00545 [Solihabitans fulvus]|uniref:Uncharacterized protein n=1 Tax=Solihabitans fulvus TaxID=1892852 RepID=A0A5B2XTQ1_9PSEU|nr:hypothetical protein [Solihabitans fulvus]KAA2267057.1 hypothetical protein F0L68_00545 [Solihabitans fulvus]
MTAQSPYGLGQGGQQPPELRNDTTRYLCGAAHTDRLFADEAIREHLVEPTRAVAPSPGVDSSAVLHEAVAARTRRKIRDGALTLLIVVFAVAAPLVLLGWVLLAVVVALPRLTGRALIRGLRLVGPKGGGLAGLLNGLIALAVLVVAVSVVLGNAGSSATSLLEGWNGQAATIISYVMAALMLTLLISDRFVVSSLLTKSLRRSRFTPTPTHDSWSGERLIRSLGHELFAGPLAECRTRASQQGQQVAARENLVVYRDYEPFLGAGVSHKPWLLTLPLDPGEDAATERPRPQHPGGPPFAMAELYDAIEQDLLLLHGSASLVPSHRFRGLSSFHQVVVSADELLDHISEPGTRTVLPQLQARPNQQLPEAELRALMEQPTEWMRYYRGFRVETWDRDLVISAYLHVGADDRTLYVEWTPCVLLPVRREYQELDTLVANPWRAVGQGIMRLVRLPVTIPGRFWHTVVRLRPMPQHAGALVPAKYGGRRNLRELGADEAVHSYFQRADVDRYLGILEGRLNRAIGRFLERKGISVTEFMAQAAATSTTLNYIGGPVLGNIIQATSIAGGITTQQPPPAA